MTCDMEFNEAMIKSWLDRISEWARLGTTGNCIVEMTNASEELKCFLTELKGHLTNLVCIFQIYNVVDP